MGRSVDHGKPGDKLLNGRRVNLMDFAHDLHVRRTDTRIGSSLPRFVQ